MKALDKTIKYWYEIERYVTVPRKKVDYLAQLDLLEDLISLPVAKRDAHLSNLIDLLVKNIKVYERAKQSKRLTTAVEVLLSLMEEHNLTQADLPEIGSQSLVSKILKGERNLTAKHIRKLSKRFHVSPAVFFD